MHRAAFPAAETALLSENLEHHALHIAAFGDAVAVAAVRASDVILNAEMNARARGDGLLPRIQMYEAGDVARHEFDVNAVLEFPDGAHSTIRIE